MSLRLRLTLLYSTLMGAILLVISAAVTLVITSLLLNQIDDTLEAAQQVIIQKIVVDEVGRVPKVNASFADIGSQQYVSLTGTAEVIRDKAKIEELWQPQLRAWFPEGVDTPDIALLKVSVERGEYWDGSQSFLAHAVNFAASLLSGKPAKLGENEKIDLAS